ncbi:MAG TPA: PKD domain-containing protein [Chitinophagaceae bacterium]
MKNTRSAGERIRVPICFILPAIFAVSLNLRSSAQAPVANFTADVTTGCSPLVVQFTDQSTGIPSTWYWDLGNGSTSSVQNPTSTYVTPGTYTITLTVTNASGSSTKSGTVTVTDGPIAKFTSTDTAGCTPHTVTFTDQSTTPGGSIVAWEWNFGDGATSTQQNPTHTYTMSGTFNVYLKITNSTGCSQTVFKQQYIRAGAGAQANFIANVPTYCQVPVTVSFSNNSQSDGTVTYLWDFGDGNTSTLQNPSHTYTAFGNYTVTLTVQSADGCNSNKQQLIQLAGKNVSFTGPSSVCVGSPVSFQMTSSPKPLSQTWSMGDGASYADTVVTHTYNTPGNYTITLSNEFSGGCVATKTQAISVVAGPVVDFTADTTKACKPAFTVNFQATGGATGFAWSFGDSTTSTAQNPTHTYQTSGEFTVRLTATNSTGCVGTVEKAAFVKIVPPAVSISNLPVNDGCTPYSFSPIANVNATEGVASYFWDFGNGYTSTLPDPSYTYTTPGSYTIKLRVQTNGGCVDSVVYQNGVNIGSGVDLDFVANPATTCVDQPVSFSMTSSATPTSYQWYFGDGDSASTAAPIHNYKNAGKYSVTLMIKYGNCTSKLTRNQYVEVLPPEAKFSALRDCNNKLLINFKNESVGTGSVSWNFGDGGTSTATDPSHQYAGNGTYNVTLTVSNGTCTHSLTQQIEVSNASIDFSSSANIVCKGEQFTLRAAVPNTVGAAQYQWTISNSGSANTAVDSIDWTLYASGTYDVALTVVSTDGCVESVSKPAFITAYGPTANFVANRTGGCENTTINFTDSSSSDGLHPVIQWNWDFGDASVGSGNAVSHSYPNTGKYNVSLTVTDTYGCTDVRNNVNFVSITNGKAMFTSLDSMSCMGKNVVFQDTSSGNISSWDWDFGDGTVMTGVQNPAHSYPDSGYYTVKLKITETSGCTDSITKTNYVTIRNPVARFGLSDTFSTCPPLTVSFYDSSYYVKKWHWDFGDGGSSPVASPTNLYNIPDVYNVKLTVTSPGGCTDTANAKIRILGPYGTFDYSPLSGCTPVTATYSVTSAEAVKFLWDYSDGVVDSGTVASSSHTYVTGGKFVPKVILTDAAGCRVPVIGKDTIYLEKTNLEFSGSQLSICDSGTVVFTNQSIDVIPGTQFQWTVNNNSYNTTDATESFTKPGSYDVTLWSTTPGGCEDTLTKSAYVRIHSSPVAAIQSEDSLCRPATFHFSAQLQPDTSSIKTWSWEFGNNQSSGDQTPQPQLFDSDGNFLNTLFLEDSEGCTTTVTKTVTVHPLPNIDAERSTLICRGDSIQLSATGGVNYTWSGPANSLSCTNCADPVAYPSFDAVFKVEGSSGFGCTATDSVLVQVFQPFNLSVDPSSIAICSGKQIQLRAYGAPLYTWSPSSGLSSTSIANPLSKPDSSIIYQVVGYDSLGCFRDSLEVTITVLDTPSVNAGPDVTLAAGGTASLQATGSADVLSYQWSPALGLSCVDCINPVVTAGNTTTYTVRVKNAAGCVAQDQVNVFVTCNQANIFVPNTFTPNGDGMNDVFYIRGNGVFAVKSLRIFNRWGEMIFEKKDISANIPTDGWNGLFKGVPASTDTYVYQLEVLCTNSEVVKYNGTVSLIR